MDSQDREQLPYRIIFKELEDEPISDIRVEGELQRAIIDELVDLFKQCIQNARKPFVLINVDLSHPSIRYTPYSRQRSEDIFTMIPDNKIMYLAICVRGGTMHDFLRLLVRQDNQRYNNIVQRVFTERDDAYAWLREKAKKYRTPKQGQLDDSHHETDTAAD